MLNRLRKKPKHIAIILDGNGRWAKQKSLSRYQGHREGVKNLSKLLDFILKAKVPVISLYAFSTENWKRPRKEISSLWRLLSEFIQNQQEKCSRLGIQIRVSGNIEKLPKKLQKEIVDMVKFTQNNKKLIANFCINYGSHDEILEASTKIVKKRILLFQKKGLKSASRKVKKDEFEKMLYTCGLGPTDLLIRTGGEMRLSNFLLWQSAYAEIYVTDKLWPEFSEIDLHAALDWYSQRKRKFGAL